MDSTDKPESAMPREKPWPKGRTVGEVFKFGPAASEVETDQADTMAEIVTAIDRAGFTFRILPCPSCKSEDTIFGSHDGGEANCKACGLKWTYGPLRTPREDAVAGESDVAALNAMADGSLEPKPEYLRDLAKRLAVQPGATEERGEPTPCFRCGKDVFGYEPQRCCDGFECGCMGLPIEPPLCAVCDAKFMAPTEPAEAEEPNDDRS